MKSYSLAVTAVLALAAAQAFADDSTKTVKTTYSATVATQTTTEAEIEPAEGNFDTQTSFKHADMNDKSMVKSNPSTFKTEKTQSNEATPEESM